MIATVAAAASAAVVASKSNFFRSFGRERERERERERGKGSCRKKIFDRKRLNHGLKRTSEPNLSGR